MIPRRDSGFTLIEMIIAFAILSLSLTVLYGSLDAALSRSRRDARFSEAILIAKSLLARAGTEWPLTTGTREGQEGAYSYKMVSTEIAPPVSEQPFTLPIFQILATVSWPGGNGQRSIDVSTLKLAPKFDP
jgi:general secretion pathway protein I